MKIQDVWKRWEARGKQLKDWVGGTSVVRFKNHSIALKPARLAAVLILLLILLAVLCNVITLPWQRIRPLEMDFETGGDYELRTLGDDVLLFNKQHMKAVDTRGKVLWSADVTLSAPVLDVAGKNVLLADLSGNHYAACYRDGKMRHEYTLGNDIISAKVNRHGYAAFATDTDGYKGRVTVFDGRGKEVFSWNSGEGYIMDVDLTDSGRVLAVAQLLSDGEQAGTRIQFIDLARKEVSCTASLEGQVVSFLRFRDDDKLIAVSDASVTCYTKSARQIYQISFAGKKPSRFHVESDSLMAFVTTDSRGNAVVELYNGQGKLRGSYQPDSGVTGMEIHGRTLVLSKGREIQYVNSRGKLRKSLSCSHDVKNIGIFGDGRHVLAVGGTTADILKFR